MDAPRAGATRFSQRHNSRIAYDPGSPPGMDDAPIVLLLHDLLADRGEFAAQRATLASAARVIVPDARGHGASATLANQWYTVAELAMDAQAILDLERVRRAHVVGHGLGAAAAFELARRAPDRVATLTLVEPALYAILDNDPDPAVVGLRNELRANDRAAADDAYKGLLDKALDTYVRPRWGAGWRERVPRPRLAAVRRHAAALAGLLPASSRFAGA
jgi:pimeloyl-ACP methyl ester carboxylesterase